MRTTLTIDDDLLSAARDRARAEHRTVGQVLSDMARRGFANTNSGQPRDIQPTPDAGLASLGVLPFPSRGGIVTNDLVNQLREEIGV